MVLSFRTMDRHDHERTAQRYQGTIYCDYLLQTLNYSSKYMASKRYISTMGHKD
ncbi:hypothetical protein Gotri_012451 [Gossypium trilobum]|uniref:Uncharacterized protein n=1 Tax=Gossypium trilobum TaxID=34281 RepID=A0A7J9DRA9_9ROSI|nr:hypothetical protein [Gossypium trilobum]